MDHSLYETRPQVGDLKASVEGFLEKCKQLKVLVVGDLMIDRYLWGKVERISPEAPVPVVDISGEENRLGGAANVALNVHAMGALPVLCGVVGNDKDGDRLIQLAADQGFDTQHILVSDQRRTTVKVRIIAHQQQMLRVDKEDRFRLHESERTQVLEKLLPSITDFDAVIFEDYDKSMIDPVLIAAITEACLEAQIPILVDPKFKQFWDYHKVTVFKPNMKELNEGLGLRLAKDDFAGIAKGVGELRKRMPHSYTLITLSEHGMLWVDEKLDYTHVPAHYRNITDVSGAGDTVISVMSLGLAAGLDLVDAVRYANLAGGLVCEEVGVVPVSRERLKGEVLG